MQPSKFDGTGTFWKHAPLPVSLLQQILHVPGSDQHGKSFVTVKLKASNKPQAHNMDSLADGTHCGPHGGGGQKQLSQKDYVGKTARLTHNT